ncbi:Rv3235 family protein [Demequina sp.]|uniref:Rv3235 family protein n=1 Tax=Demequina sp. TaxID=2050685 RepID=UPI003D0B1FB5
MSAEAAVASGGLRAIPGGQQVPRYGVKREQLGDPTALACTVAKTAAEVAMGGEGLTTLTPWVAQDVRDSLAAQCSLSRRAGHRGATARIERARVCRVSHRAAEVSIVALVRGRALAIAMRLEDIHGRWLATVIEIV